jgi:hypothetical protein
VRDVLRVPSGILDGCQAGNGDAKQNDGAKLLFAQDRLYVLDGVVE